MMKIISIISFILIGLLGISFACINTTLVTINYYIGEVNFPISILLGITLTIGLIIGLFWGWWNSLKLRWVNRQLRSEILSLKKVTRS